MALPTINPESQNNSFSLASTLIILIIFIIFFGISFMIQDIKYRVCYYMILALLFLASLNIYLSIVYYIQLRNLPGVQGPMGPKGPQGMTGNTGKCSFSEKCGIANPRGTILTSAVKMYKPISRQCLDTPNLGTCGDQDTLDQAVPINAQINMLETLAQNSSMSQRDFEEKLNVCITDPNSCMDLNDF